MAKFENNKANVENRIDCTAVLEKFDIFNSKAERFDLN